MPLGDATKTFNVEVVFGVENSQFMQGMQRIGQGMVQAGRTLTQNITLPIVALGTAAVTSAVKFNTAMADVSTLIPGQVERLGELKTAAQEMAIEYGKATTEMADGTYDVISAFGDSDAMFSQLDINTRLSIAGFSSLSEAVDFTSAVTKGYGDTSAEMMELVANLGLETVRLGQTTFPELASSIGSVTGTAEAMGVTVEELLASYATLTGVTGSTSEVSTQLKGVLNALMKPASSMTAAIDGLGFAGSEAMVRELGLVGAMRELIDTTDGSNEAIAKLFPNIEALPAVFALSSGSVDVFDAKLADMSDGADTLGAAFEAATEGVNEAGHSWNQLKARGEVFLQMLGDAMLPLLSDLMENYIAPLAEKLTGWAETFRDMDPAMQQTILTVIAIIAALGPLLMLLGQIVLIAPALGTAVSVMFGPWGLLIAAVIAGIALLVQNWDTIRPHLQPIINWFLRLWGEVKDWFIEQIPKMAEVWESVLKFFTVFWEKYGGALQIAWSLIWTAIKIAAEVVWNAIKLAWEVFWTLLKGTFDFWTAVLQGDWEGAWEAIKETAITIWDSIKDFIGDSLMSIWNNLLGFFDDVKEGWKNFYNELVGQSIIPDGNLMIEENFRATFDNISTNQKAFVTEFNNRMRELYGPEWIDVDPFGMGTTPDTTTGDEGTVDTVKETTTDYEKALGNLESTLINSARKLGQSIATGDIAKTLQNIFGMLGNSIGKLIEASISTSIGGGGIFGDIVGAFGGGLIGAGISLIGGLFGGSKGPKFTEQEPGWINVGNWKDFWEFGFTLPGTYVMSGRAGANQNIGPHGWVLDATREGQRLGYHYDQ